MRQDNLNIVVESIDIKILEKIKKAKRGSLFYTEDFLSFGNYKAVSKALERLVNTNEISRVSRGIFAVLEKDPIIGEVYPSTEEIAESILENDILFIRVIGGILFPLKDEYNFLNLMTEFRKEAEVILVAENKKGILNHVYLTVDVLHRNNISTKEVIYIKKNEENMEKEENIIKVSNSLKIPFSYL